MQIGFRYGTIVEDFYTGYRLHCEGWKSLFCNPDRAAFLGDVPITLFDVLSQCKRWCIGFLEVAFSKYNPLIFGSPSIGLSMSLGYSHYALWPIWWIPITFYSFIPQLALINKVSIFPEVRTLMKCCIYYHEIFIWNQCVYQNHIWKTVFADIRSMVSFVCFSFPRRLRARFPRIYPSRRFCPNVVECSKDMDDKGTDMLLV